MTGGRLLYVSNVAWFFTSHRLHLALAARAAGYDVHVAAAQDSGAEKLEAEGFTVHALPLARGEAGGASELGTLLALDRLYRALAPRIVHHVTIKPVLYGSLAARRVGVPVTVNAVTGLGTLFIASGARARMRRAVVLAALRLGAAHRRCWHIFQNQDDQATYIRAGIAVPERSVLIPGAGVDLAAFAPGTEPEGPPVIALPARLLGDKGVREFVAAARLVRARMPAARFALVGGLDPDNPSAVPEAEVRGWVASGDVEWWGHRSDMPSVLRGATVVCLPSYREGMPKALLEAAAAGRAIVTTDVPGCRDVVGHEREGLLVPARDTAALAGAVARLLDDASLRVRLGSAARVRAELEFGEGRVAATTLALYADALARCA